MPRRMMRDRRRMRGDRRSMRRKDYGSYGWGNDYHYDYPEYDSRGDYRRDSRRSDSRMGRDSEYDREYSMDSRYYDPYMMKGDYRGRRDRRRDYRDYRDRASEEDYLTDEELMEWAKDLLRDVPEKDRPYFTKDNIERKTKEMGMKFDDYTFSELYTAALMLYNDYSKTLGTANMDIYIRMSKDFFEDDDAELQGSEKLATYYDEIVCAE